MAQSSILLLLIALITLLSTPLTSACPPSAAAENSLYYIAPHGTSFNPPADAIVLGAKDSTNDDANKIITLKPNQHVVLKLKSNPTTGYMFQLSQSTHTLLTENSSSGTGLRYQSCEYAKPAKGLIGAKGQEFWWFSVGEALSSSTETLKLDYIRPSSHVNEDELSDRDVISFQFQMSE